MNLTELNNEFTILFEDLATQGSKGLNAYERSVCFTYVQEAMVRALAKENILDPIANLVDYSEEVNIQSSIYETAKDFTKVDNPFYVLTYFIKSNTKGDVGTIAADEKTITALMAASYKYPPKNLAYVVMGETKVTVFPPYNYDLKSCVTKYITYPTPVILDNLTGGYTINGLTVPTDPILDSSFHREMVNQAVEYAIKVYIGQPEKQIKDDGPRSK